MIDVFDKLFKDFEAVRNIPIVLTMLEVICRTTGMGFSAVARVTEDRWLACSVRDEIKFGLNEGEELKLETTICNEIKDSHKPVIIDHVSEDEHFWNHHTPKMYGFQSYISFPIFLKNGDFFGTLCAIDPNPVQLNNEKFIGLFTLFAELLSFHLMSNELVEKSHNVLTETNKELVRVQNENDLHHHFSNHQLAEPIRKIRLFSDMLMNSIAITNMDEIKDIASKINTSTTKLSQMVHDIKDSSSSSNRE